MARAQSRLPGTARLLVVTAVAGLALLALAAARAETVLTGTQATYSLTTALVAGTDIEVANVPPELHDPGGEW